MVFRLVVISALFLLSLVGKGQNISLKEGKNFKVEKVDGKEILLSFTTSIENVSSKGVGVTIKKGKLYKDGEYFGSFTLPKKIKLKAKSNDNLNVQIKVMLEKELDLKQGLQALMGKQTELKLTGIAKATWFIFWKKYPFEYHEKISLKNLLGK